MWTIWEHPLWENIVIGYVCLQHYPAHTPIDWAIGVYMDIVIGIGIVIMWLKTDILLFQVIVSILIYFWWGAVQWVFALRLSCAKACDLQVKGVDFDFNICGWTV